MGEDQLNPYFTVHYYFLKDYKIMLLKAFKN